MAQYLSCSQEPIKGKHKECQGTPGVGGYRSVAILHNASLKNALTHPCQLGDCVQVQPETLSLQQLKPQESFVQLTKLSTAAVLEFLHMALYRRASCAEHYNPAEQHRH